MDYFPLRLNYKSNILEFSVFSILVNYNAHLMYITHLERATDIQFEMYSAYSKCRRNHPDFNYF